MSVRESSKVQNVEAVNHVTIFMEGGFLTAPVWEEAVALLVGDSSHRMAWIGSDLKDRLV